MAVKGSSPFSKSSLFESVKVEGKAVLLCNIKMTGGQCRAVKFLIG